jgi:flagellar motor switch protein FliM
MLPTAELSPLRPSRFSLKEIRAQADIMDVFARARQMEIAQYARIDHLIHCHSTL